MVDIKRLIKTLRLNRLSCGIKKPCSDCELMEDCLYYQQNGAKEAADIIEHLEAENATLREQLAERDKQIKQWENALSAFDDGIEPTQDVLNLLSDTDELKKWIARAAWHCHKVSEMNGEIERLNVAVECRDNMLADQTKALSDLQGRFDIINNFEQSQCAALLLKISERDKTLARITAERDAALNDLRGKCSVCVHYTPNHNEGVCAHCSRNYMSDVIACSDCWQWRGPQKEDDENDE